MTPVELRRSFAQFNERLGSVEVPSASLLPENDSSTLFTGSGMQPMLPYLLGDKHPTGNDIVNIQRCVRTGDIEEIGDDSHLTYFEMIGRWEFGGDPENFKKEQIHRMFHWQIDELGLDINRFYISVFAGQEEFGIPLDQEAIDIWSELLKERGIDPIVEHEPEKYGTSRGGRIFVYGASENWWSRAGVPENMPVGEPGGPDSEMFYDFEPDGDKLDHPASDTSRFLEIGNNVFMSHIKEADGNFSPLPKPNIDYGGGFERISAALNNDPDVYKTPFFASAMQELENLSGKSYAETAREFRVILDHIRASTFLIADGAVPANAEAGYVTRRLMRRAIRTGKKLGMETGFAAILSNKFLDDTDEGVFSEADRERIIKVVSEEERQFLKTLAHGEREIEKFIARNDTVTGADAFDFFQTYGFPMELTEEFLAEKNMSITDLESYETAAQKHSELSKTASAGKFKGGLADNSEKTTALHSSVHLLLAGLRKVLGDHVHQRGSNITAERARFDFSHDGKMTPEEIQQVEEYVNKGIQAAAQVEMIEMAKQKALDDGIEGSFWEKYPEQVKVYVFEDPSGGIWSKELCGGPHVDNTKDIAEFGTFKIKKEGSVSAGTRRIRAEVA